MSVTKRIRQGQILKIISGEQIASQEDLRRRLYHVGVRVNQATLSRDLHDLKLVKTEQGYRQLAGPGEEKSAPSLAQVLREFLTEVRPAQNLLVLKTPPAAVLVRKAIGIEKGSGTPNTKKVGKITRKQLEAIAQQKMPDLTAADLDAAVRTIAGSARSMGVDVEGT